MKLQLNIAIVFLSMVALVSCNDDIFSFNNDDGTISFSTEVFHSRASSFTEGRTDNFTSMGVYSTVTATDWTIGNSTSWNNQEVNRNNGLSGWYYSPPRSWEPNRKHTFFAYAPYLTNVAGLSVSELPVAGIPLMTYTVPTDHTSQRDLLVANAKYNLQDTLTGAVNLTMNHAMTRVVFSARTLHSVHADSVVKITKIELVNIANKGTRLMDFNPANQWTLDNPTVNKATYEVTNAANGGLDDRALNQSLAPIESLTGNLFLMPQAFSSDDAEFKITYITTHAVNGHSAKGPHTLSKPISHFLDGFLQNEAIRFMITIPNSAQPEDFVINVSYVDWDDRRTDVSLPSDPFLDITNVEVKAYDAAVTRVYFYTNQPLMLNSNKNVFIDPTGRVGSNAGATFNVAEEFQDITGTVTTNFHFDDATNKGYVDIINVNTNTAGDRPNNGKNLLIIKLRAGKLVRDISVQPVVTTEASKGNSTPYIGTFHRHSQTGERIVTWHLPITASWTATIDEVIGESADLCIDRFASPDFANNILYSYTPRDAEGAKVDETDRSVSGKGRVYFRVGWKSTSSSNRYARIRVTGANVGGAGVNELYIYCRQGETEQKIANAESLYAVYNVAMFRQFTQYPTQAGMLYQWNRTHGWDPLGVLPPPAYPNDSESTFAHERNACPEGYLYPSTLQQLEMTQVLGAGGTAKQWGYYADGFFDRRRVNVIDHRVDASTLDVAGAGIMFFNATSARAIFLPTTGYREQNADISKHGALKSAGTHSGYWTDIESGSDVRGAILHRTADATAFDNRNKTNAYSLRCMKADPLSSWIIIFDANKAETAPVSITVPYDLDKNTTIKIPSEEPTNYFRPNYEFKGWNTKADGTGTTFLPNSSYTTAQLSLGKRTLYAKWELDPYIKIDFRNYVGTSSYLLTVGSNNIYTEANNGTKYSSQTTLMANEKAYPKLRFSNEKTAGTWNYAYQTCLSLPEDGGGWRLPRAIEFQLINNGSPVSSLKAYQGIISDTSLLWTASESSGNPFYISWYGGLMTDRAKSTPTRFRCVKELPR